MVSRGRGISLGSSWDPMMEDYNNDTYDSQLPDQETNGGVQLDHRRLYITGLPKNLIEQGLHRLFSKYGTLTECYVSSDPKKKYGLITYSTPSEASAAMAQLNKTEPLRLHISIAHKKKIADQPKRKERCDNGPKPKESDGCDAEVYDRHNAGSRNKIRSRINVTSDDGYSTNQDQSRRHKDDTRERERYDVEVSDRNSVGSRGKSNMRKEMAFIDDDIYSEIYSNDDMLDEEVDLELELEKLKLKQAQLLCKQKLRALQLAEKRSSFIGNFGSRSMLPDGKIVVRSYDDKTSVNAKLLRDLDNSISEENRSPGLRRDVSRACVACGARAVDYCAGCRLTPYCSARCQAADWARRHSAVCHNLATQGNGFDDKASGDMVDSTDYDEYPPVAPLRRPLSPKPKRDTQVPLRKPNQEPKRGNNDQDGALQKFLPPDHSLPSYKAPQNRNVNKAPASESRPAFHNRNRPSYNKPVSKENENDDEDWGPKIDDKKEENVKQVSMVKSAKATPPVSPVKKVVSSPVQKPVKPDVMELVPKNCLLELVAVGDAAVLSVESAAGGGFLCVALHRDHQEDYRRLCEDYVADCERETRRCEPGAGATFSLFAAEEGAWFRARRLGARAAMLDAGRVAALPAPAHAHAAPLAAEYAALPEFTCLLRADCVQIGDQLSCKILSRDPDGVMSVELEDGASGAKLGEGTAMRWRPEIEEPAPAAPIITAVLEGAEVPAVPRPALQAGAPVVLLEAGLVRPHADAARRRHELLLQDVAVYGRKAPELTEPPVKGQTVVAQYTDGVYYRALVTRTSVKNNKYMIEYIEYGNTEKTSLERLRACPAAYSLEARPTLAARVALAAPGAAPSAAALAYLEDLKEQATPLLLTLPGDAETAPSGSEATLTVVQTKENVNKKVMELSTPKWKKMELNGEDVMQSEVLMDSELEYVSLPTEGGALQVLDASLLAEGDVGACRLGEPHIQTVMGPLSDAITQYCESELGKEQYLPRCRELCIAKFHGSWYRAVFGGQEGAGGARAAVLYVDYGNLERVPVADVRKMLPEFVRGQPALACDVLIKDFPEEPSEAALAKARQFMGISSKSPFGILHVARCTLLERGHYEVEAPELLEAMAGL